MTHESKFTYPVIDQQFGGLWTNKMYMLIVTY